MSRQHPLQRLASPSPTVSLALHLAGVASFSYNFYFLTTWDVPIADAYGWHFQFLTILGLSAALLAFSLAALADLTLSPALFRAKNVVAVLAAPVEVVVAILYWGLYLIDPTLLVEGDFQLPLLVDMGFHLAPAVLLAADFVLLSPPWTVPAYGVVALSGSLASAYWIWVEHCFSHNGWYPYPIFALLSTPQRLLLFTFAAFLSTGSSIGLSWVYGKVNGYEGVPVKKIQ
ncbi:FAR-17a/AIG1-like protein [Geosmithia morbida]|uniref:FAR-17a/AIG1-like protein n=1 Tax=Geosmithia morbida TaxID=1094350 RepID=A0A9P4YYA6_9HYPO|nr:FAR-17a/AIG1-like protein [Geosmithia morbida]KAF4124014.1 FAR-17a/AIG1-like protein [Geosmithia morbida]